jgi:hypothetical protein
MKLYFRELFELTLVLPLIILEFGIALYIAIKQAKNKEWSNAPKI